VKGWEAHVAREMQYKRRLGKFFDVLCMSQRTYRMNFPVTRENQEISGAFHSEMQHKS
jgi:hypothetical protein